MHSLIALLTLLCNTAICVRLITYRSGPDARRRHGIGWLAWLLIASTGGQAMDIMLLGAHARPSIWQLGVVIVLMVLAFRAHGNVASIMRME